MRKFLVGIVLSATLLPVQPATATWSGQVMTHLREVLEMACKGRSECLAQVGDLALFLWRHSDEANLQLRTVRCLGQTAMARGYVWSPGKMFEIMTPDAVPEIAAELCGCVVPTILEAQVCRSLK